MENNVFSPVLVCHSADWPVVSFVGMNLRESSGVARCPVSDVGL